MLYKGYDPEKKGMIFDNPCCPLFLESIPHIIDFNQDTDEFFVCGSCTHTHPFVHRQQVIKFCPFCSTLITLFRQDKDSKYPDKFEGNDDSYNGTKSKSADKLIAKHTNHGTKFILPE